MMLTKTQKKKILHYPTLKTVLAVEEVLKKAEKALNKEQIKSKLPTKIQHQTLNLILNYLEDSGKIFVGKKGVLWTYNPSRKLKKAIEKGTQVR